MNDNGTLTNYTPDPVNQYTAITGQGAAYDGNFSLSYLNGGNVYYDAEKHVTSITVGGSPVAQFVYDGLGRCLKRTLDNVTTLFLYHGWQPLMEWDGAGNMVAYNIYGVGPDEILTRWQSGVGYLHYHLDRMGNVQFLLSEGNAGLERYTYDAFGEPTVTDWDGSNGRRSSNYGNRFMFTGREYFPSVALYDFRNRFYRPSLGRFLQGDPAGFDGGDTNLFRYCGGDPVNRSDPMGLSGILTIYSNYGNAAAALWNGNTGHSWISYTSDTSGRTTFYGTDSNGMRYSDGYSADVMRQAWINDSAEGELYKYIQYTQSLGFRAWSTSSDCTLFATVAWAAATGEALRYLNDFGIGSPSAVADSIVQMNGGHDYAFHFSDGGNGYYFNDGSFGRYDSDGNGYYIWDPTAPPGTQIGQRTDGTPIYQDGGGGFGTFGGGPGGGTPAYGQLSNLVSTGGGGWVTAGYFPSGGEPGEGFHPVGLDLE